MTLEHFRIRFRLGQEVPDALWKTIDHQEYYESYTDYLHPVESKGKEASTSVKASPSSEEPSGGRPHKRARRSAAQAVASYSLMLAESDPIETTNEREMALDDEDSDDGSRRDSPSASGIRGDDNLRQADQLALWIKHLADILHEESRQVSQIDLWAG